MSHDGLYEKQFEEEKYITTPDLGSYKWEGGGGPAKYYDFPEEWVTVNDIIEYKSEKQWGKYTWHLANIFKATWRWGTKSGTTREYDAKKIIYSACRILKSMVGTSEMRRFLEENILDDQQFK